MSTLPPLCLFTFIGRFIAPEYLLQLYSGHCPSNVFQVRITKHLETFYCRNECSFYCATFRYDVFAMKWVSFDLRIKIKQIHDPRRWAAILPNAEKLTKNCLSLPICYIFFGSVYTIIFKYCRLVILETNEAKKWEIRDVFNVLCNNYTYPLEFFIMKSRLR